MSPFTGKWFYRHVDLEIPGIFPIELVRRYDSQTTYQSPLGAGWAYTYDWRLLKYADGSLTVRNACGQLHRYSASDLTTTDAPGWRLSLAADPGVPGGYVLSEPRGTRRFFDVQGRMTKIRDPQGNELRFTYAATKLPLSGTSPYAANQTTPLITSHHYPLLTIEEATAAGTLTGRSITFSYDATSGRLVSARSHDGRGVVYTHQMITVNGQLLTTGNLTQVRFETTPGGAGGVVQTFGYTDTTFPHAVTSFQDGAGRRAVKNVYDAQGRVLQQLLAAPDTVAFDFVYAPTAANFLYSADFGMCVAPATCRVVKESILSPTSAPATAVTAYVFRADGYPLREIDAQGHLTVHTYDGPTSNYLDKTEVYRIGVGGPASRSLEKVTDFEFVSGNLMTRMVEVATATGGSETITESWTYDQDWPATHTLVSSAPPSDEFRTSFTFVRAGRVPSDPNYIAADPIDNVHSTLRLHFDDTPEATIFGYDGNGRLTRVTQPDGHAQIFPRYTAADDSGGVIRNGLVRRRAHEDGGVEDAHLKTLVDYDAAGRVASETDARGFETQFAWDALGRLATIENPLGERTLLTYGSPDGSAEGWQLVRIETGQTTAAGEGRTTKLLYDGAGHLAQIQRKTGTGTATFAVFATYANDSAGRRVSSTDAEMRTTTLGWDLLGRVTSVTDAASPPRTTSFAYDASGNRTKLTDAQTPVARVTDFVYDALDRLIRIEALGPNPDEITQFAYDAAGNVTKVTDPKGQATAYAYDGLSRLTSVTQALGIATPGDPDDFTVGYAYDGRGRLEHVTNARGQILRSFYFAWGGLEKQVYDLDGDGAESGEREVAYSYDLGGHVTSTSDSDGVLGFSGPLYTADPSTGYDALGRLRQLSVHFPASGSPRTLTSSYNRFGERTQLDLAQGAEILSHNWAYDALGRLDTATFPGSPTPIDFTSLDNDTLERITRPSGATTDYTYFPQGPIESITVKAGGTDQISRLAYTVNAVQNITNLSEQHATSDPTGAYVFDYDQANRLQLGDYPAAYGLPPDQRYAYDPAGNRDDADSSFVALGTHSYDANNRLTASPGIPSYSFDDDGNLTARTGETFGYDATNRLRAFSKSGTAATYAYDPFGRRIQKTVNGVTTWYLWDGDQLLAEYGDSGARTVRYAYAGGFAPSQVAYKDGASEDVYDVHSDHLDTPRLLTDDAGAVAWREAHEAFGKANLDAGNTVTFNVRFPGQYYDAETERWDPTLNSGAGGAVEGSGLHDNWYRSYTPELGRYISADPIGQFGGVNEYLYALNNPLNLFDPSGLFVWPAAPGAAVVTTGIGAVGAAGVVVAGAAGYAIGTAIEPYVSPLIEPLIDAAFGDPLADTAIDAPPNCETQAGKRRPPREPNKPGRKKQGREPGEKKRQDPDWQPRNPPKEPPKHTPSRKD